MLSPQRELDSHGTMNRESRGESQSASIAIYMRLFTTRRFAVDVIEICSQNRMPRPS